MANDIAVRTHSCRGIRQSVDNPKGITKSWESLNLTSHAHGTHLLRSFRYCCNLFFMRVKGGYVAPLLQAEMRVPERSTPTSE